jgi:hypothetical protein
MGESRQSNVSHLRISLFDKPLVDKHTCATVTVVKAREQIYDSTTLCQTFSQTNKEAINTNSVLILEKITAVCTYPKNGASLATAG